jgi:hypothetical protein
MYFYCYDYVFSLYVYVWLPWLRFFRAFSSVVRQMPGYNPQKRGTVRTLPNFCVVIYISVLFYLFLCCYMYCFFCDVFCIVCVCMCTEQLPQPPMQWVRGFCPKRQRVRIVAFTTQLHIMLSLRMSGAIPLLRLYASMVWTETALRFLSAESNMSLNSVQGLGPRSHLTSDTFWPHFYCWKININPFKTKRRPL